MHSIPQHEENAKLLKTKSYKTGIISNGKAIFQMKSIKALEIEDFFDCILLSETEGVRKPDSAIYQKALAALGVVPNEAVYIGDHPINDIRASQQVGMKAIWKINEEWQDADTAYKITDLVEIPDLIARL